MAIIDPDRHTLIDGSSSGISVTDAQALTSLKALLNGADAQATAGFQTTGAVTLNSGNVASLAGYAALSYQPDNGARRPLWSSSDADFNGYPSVTFNGQDLDAGFTSAATAFTWICVVKVLAALTSYACISRYGNCTVYQALTGNSHQWGAFGNVEIPSGVVLSTGRAYVLGVVARAANDIDLWTNLSMVNVTAGASYSGGSNNVGMLDVPSTFPGNFKTPHQIFYPTARTTIANDIRLLMARYNVQP
jgi:hypothetical protein